jgi:hypothetical protein
MRTVVTRAGERKPLWSLLLAAVVAGCGADPGASDASVRDATPGASDAQVLDAHAGDAAQVDAATDASEPVAPDAGAALDAAVPDGGACIPASCDDGDPCNGVERCEGAAGCVPGAPPCNDQQACEPGGRCRDLYPARRVGIFYHAWHAYASDAIRQRPPAERYTIETSVRDDARTPFGMLHAHGLAGEAGNFHYHVEPTLGFYCLYRERPGEAPYPGVHAITPCPNIAEVAEAHARLLWDAGVDFVFVDLTNLPTMSPFADVLGLRPLEVLAEEWAALRARGVMTPQLAAWLPLAPVAAGETPMWQAVLVSVYARPELDALILRDARSGRKVLFGVENAGLPLDPASVRAAQLHGGRDDVLVAPLWGLATSDELAGGRASWMQPCEAPGPPAGALTFTTLVAPDNPCLQRYTTTSPLGTVLSVSASYQLGYASLPYLASGKRRGLTLRRQFLRAFEVQPDYLLINSWNELIAQPQVDPNLVGLGPHTRSMGEQAGDPSADWLWVDTYGAEFSRDLEPTVEAGDGAYRLLRSCLEVYRAGGCAALQGAACCANDAPYRVVFSLRVPDPDRSMDTDHLATTDFGEVLGLLGSGAYEMVCNPLFGPPSLCGTPPAAPTTLDGPFEVFADPAPGRTPLHRCNSGVDHFLSGDPGCEGRALAAALGWVSDARTTETARALRRCYNAPAVRHFHWLGEQCPTQLPGVVDEGRLGYVR